MNWWEEIVLTAVVGILHNVIKNPKSKEAVKAAVEQVAELSQQASQALNS